MFDRIPRSTERDREESLLDSKFGRVWCTGDSGGGWRKEEEIGVLEESELGGVRVLEGLGESRIWGNGRERQRDCLPPTPRKWREKCKGGRRKEMKKGGGYFCLLKKIKQNFA